jgi:hypothetical protein
VRHVIPPYIPPVQPLQTVAGYASFDKLMQDYNSSTAAGSPRGAAAAAAPSNSPAWDLTALPTADDDSAAFSKWDFVSLRTLKIELGIAQELTAYDASFKVRQLLGDSSDCSPRGHSRGGSRNTNGDSGTGAASAASGAAGAGANGSPNSSKRGSGSKKKVQKARSLNSGAFAVLGVQFKAKTWP